MKYFAIILLVLSGCASKSKVVCEPRVQVLPADPPVAVQCSTTKNGLEHGVVFVYGRLPTDHPWEANVEER
jgi:hypothetical protein